MKKICLALCFFLMLVSLVYAEPISPKFIDGITIHGQDVSGLTANQAKKVLEPLVTDIESQKVILVAPDREKIWITTYKSMGINHNLDKAINTGLQIGNKGIFLKKWYNKLKVNIQKYNIPLQLEIDIVRANNEINRLTKSLVKSPQDAKLIVHLNNKIEIKPDISGIEIDQEKMLKILNRSLSLQGPISIPVITKEIKANVTEQDIKALKIETLLGQYTTWFNPKKKNRTLNIKNASQALNNYILKPKMEFSFNKVVGPRTKEAGYNDAPIILNNKFSQGVGGGVCQVSSTLYNVLLKANLNITERHPHSLPIRYVPKGLDAAVVYYYKDLKFTNNSNGHILIKTYVGQGSLTIKIFGYKEKDLDVELFSIVEKTIPPKVIVKNKQSQDRNDMLVEQEGTEGYQVRVERIIRDENRKVLVHEVLTRDYYPPINKVIYVNRGH